MTGMSGVISIGIPAQPTSPKSTRMRGLFLCESRSTAGVYERRLKEICCDDEYDASVVTANGENDICHSRK